MTLALALTWLAISALTCYLLCAHWRERDRQRRAFVRARIRGNR